MSHINVKWSLIIRTSTRKKLNDVHLNPVEMIFGLPKFCWNISQPDKEEGFFQLLASQDIFAEPLSEAVMQVLHMAYALADGWKIFGLYQVKQDNLINIYGAWKAEKPSHKPPSLYSALFEIQPGITI